MIVTVPEEETEGKDGDADGAGLGDALTIAATLNFLRRAFSAFSFALVCRSASNSAEPIAVGIAWLACTAITGTGDGLCSKYGAIFGTVTAPMITSPKQSNRISGHFITARQC